MGEREIYPSDDLPTVSAVIPAYNAAEYLPSCLDSVLAQTRPPDEIIVVDDGSTDGTFEMLRERYPQVTCIRQENAGASAARNTGIEHATGDLIALGDADDLWHPRRLELQARLLSARPEIDLAACVLLRVPNDAQSVEWPALGELQMREITFQDRLRRHGNIPVPTWLVRREVFGRVGMFDTALRVAEDLDIILRVLAACRAVSLRHHLYAWRARPNSLSTTGAPEYAILQYRTLARYRPTGSGEPSPLTEAEYWDLVSKWLLRGMLSAVSHDRWKDAAEIAAEIDHSPPGVGGRAMGYARLMSRIIRGTRRPGLRGLLTAVVRTGSSLTRRYRR